jgi:hypothetical protein
MPPAACSTLVYTEKTCTRPVTFRILRTCCCGAAKDRSPPLSRIRFIARTSTPRPLESVSAFAIASPGPPKIRPAFAKAWSHAGRMFAWGTVVGLLLGFSTVVVVRWGLGWFTLSLGIVLAIMMVCYVTVPARLIGIKTTHSRRDKFTAAAVGGALGVVVCTPRTSWAVLAF